MAQAIPAANRKRANRRRKPGHFNVQNENRPAVAFWLRSSRVSIASGFSPRCTITQNQSSGGATSSRADHEAMVCDFASIFGNRSWVRDDLNYPSRCCSAANSESTRILDQTSRTITPRHQEDLYHALFNDNFLGPNTEGLEPYDGLTAIAAVVEEGPCRGFVSAF